MKINSYDHAKFYDTELRAIFSEWDRYLNKEMKLLISEKELFIGSVDGANDNTGTLKIRFKEDEVPRFNTPYFLAVVGPAAEGDPENWRFTYKEFTQSPKGYWNKKGSEVVVSNYLRNQDGSAFLELFIHDYRVYDYLKKQFVDNDIQAMVVIARVEPPLKYLMNLKSFVEENSDNDILNLDVSLNEDSWKPHTLDNEYDVTEKILGFSGNTHISSIQGPPGSGKSYYAAKVAQRYLDENKSVAVCALTNKALTELSSQPTLEASLEDGKVYKTSVSRAELMRYPNLQHAESFTTIQGKLLLTTYYKLSEHFKELASSPKRYDLLIIEEASQAFLATIAMFAEIAERVLIIGDHKQLPPVYIANEKKLFRINPNIKGVINGLQTFVLNNEEHTYRFIKTRRLTNESSDLTGIFYDNQLSSISPLNDKIQHSPDIEALFHANGGVSMAKLSKIGQNSLSEKEVVSKMARVANGILEYGDGYSVAMISSTVNMEKRMTSAMSIYKPDYSRLTISTVHKAQGMTADYTLLFMPLSNSDFELNLNLFNVATSRAKRGTLIITFTHISMVVGVAPEVMQFVNGASDVTSAFNRWS